MVIWHTISFLTVTLMTAILCLNISESHSIAEEDEPEIVELIPNVTVPVGREARIPCKVRGLGTYRVAWLRVESKTILTIHHHIITRNYRIGLSHSDDKHWNLHINDVQESDRGGYMCQINTVPMKFQVGYLDVVVPPEISSDTLTDITVRENQNVTLKCSAKGHPKPTIRWRREDGRPIESGNWQEKKTQGIDPHCDDEYFDPTADTLEGETITIRKVSRLHMGAYLAIASNGVPPSVSKRILLNVHFPPMIWVPNQLIGAGVGSDAVLTCNTEAFPVSINYWTKEGEDALMPSDKYDINIVEKSYKIFMTLRIRDLTPEDFTSYKCYARNALGSTQGSIKLYEVRLPALRTDTRKKASASSVEGKDSSRATFKDLNDGMRESQLQDSAGNGGSQAEKFYLKRPSSLLIIGTLALFLLPCYSCYM